jgi:hypothetical protein
MQKAETIPTPLHRIISRGRIREEGRIVLIRTSAALTATLAAWLAGCKHQPREQASINFGTAKISLGMTKAQAERSLSAAARHIEFVNAGGQSKATVVRDGQPNDFNQSITFRDDIVVDAVSLMPTPNSVDELAEQIATAVDNMETKSCSAATDRSRTLSGTGEGRFLMIRFTCGTQRISLNTIKLSLPNHESVSTSVGIAIGQAPAR